MKTILIVYPDEYCLNTRKNCRQTHYDVNVIHFFDRLRAEGSEKLCFFKTSGKKPHEPGPDRFDHLPVDLIISYPASPEIEQYAEKRGVPYFAFDHFAQDSTYFDRFWLFNRHTLAEFDKLADNRHSRPGSLSPLGKEPAFYGRFLPLPGKSANIFYQKDKTICLCLIDESIQVNDVQKVIVQLKSAVKETSFLFGEKANLVLYGKSKKILAWLAISLGGLKTVVVNVVHENFQFSDNCVYSMIDKADLIFSCGCGKGVDAIVFNKPVVFVGADNLLFKRLNRLVTAPGDGSDLALIGRRQHEFFSRFALYLERNCLFFSNVSCDAERFHKRLANVVFRQTNKKDPIETIRYDDSNENQSGKAIVAAYVDRTSKARRLFFAYLRKKKSEQKKIAKLLNDPRAFFRDSKVPIFRLIGGYLLRKK
jgi:hypothetical protein